MKKKVIISFIIFIAVVITVGVLYFGINSGVKVDVNNLPKFVVSDFIDLDRITSISKFRSGAGHDFSSSGETCRSMKHYYTPNFNEEGNQYITENNGRPMPPDGKTDIDIFSPVDGKVVSINDEGAGYGKQIYIKSDEYSDIIFRLFHIHGDAKEGQKVSAGEKIGVIGSNQMTDIAVQLGGFRNAQFISYFDVMSDELFAEYKKRGAESRSDFIISREERDANPLKCDGEWFTENYDSGTSADHYMYLSGYKPPY